PHRRFPPSAEPLPALRPAMVEARAPTTSANVAEFIGMHLGDRIAARRDAIARAVVFASQADRRADRGRRIIGRRLRVLSPVKSDPSLIDDMTEETTKMERVPRDGVTGALAGLFGAIALLAVLASGLLLPPP